jgi:hypothetical protein
LDREGITVFPIAELELAFEVDGPNDIRARDRRLRPAGMRAPLGPSAPPSAPVPFQNAVERRDGGDLVNRIRIEQELVKLAGAPAPRFPQLENLANQRGIRRMRARLWTMGARKVNFAVRRSPR